MTQRSQETLFCHQSVMVVHLNQHKQHRDPQVTQRNHKPGLSNAVYHNPLFSQGCELHVSPSHRSSSFKRCVSHAPTLPERLVHPFRAEAETRIATLGGERRDSPCGCAELCCVRRPFRPDRRGGKPGFAGPRSPLPAVFKRSSRNQPLGEPRLPAHGCGYSSVRAGVGEEGCCSFFPLFFFFLIVWQRKN